MGLVRLPGCLDLQLGMMVQQEVETDEELADLNAGKQEIVWQ
jgi:hypothetical protein